MVIAAPVRRVADNPSLDSPLPLLRRSRRPLRALLPLLVRAPVPPRKPLLDGDLDNLQVRAFLSEAPLPKKPPSV